MFVTVEKCREESLKVPRGVIRNLKSKEDRQTRQWSKDTKGVIRNLKSKEDRQTRQWSKDTKGVIRNLKSKEDRQTMVKRYQGGNQKP